VLPLSVMTGASLAAPTDTTLVAMLLGAVPSLTWKVIVRWVVFGVLLVLS
jgi:hypothetical protein